MTDKKKISITSVPLLIGRENAPIFKFKIKNGFEKLEQKNWKILSRGQKHASCKTLSRAGCKIISASLKSPIYLFTMHLRKYRQIQSRKKVCKERMRWIDVSNEPFLLWERIICFGMRRKRNVCMCVCPCVRMNGSRKHLKEFGWIYLKLFITRFKSYFFFFNKRFLVVNASRMFKLNK